MANQTETDTAEAQPRRLFCIQALWGPNPELDELEIPAETLLYAADAAAAVAAWEVAVGLAVVCRTTRTVQYTLAHEIFATACGAGRAMLALTTPAGHLALVPPGIPPEDIARFTAQYSLPVDRDNEDPVPRLRG